LLLGKETFNQSTQRHSPAEWPPNQHRYKGLKSRTFVAEKQWIKIYALTALFCHRLIFQRVVIKDTNIIIRMFLVTRPSGHAVQGVGLQTLARWDFEFESRRGHGCLSL
jgi:hypothetical protein